MQDVTYLQFVGLRSPVALHRAEDLLPQLYNALPKWPVTVSNIAPEAPPFIKITGVQTDMFEVAATGDGSAPRRWDAVNTICDLISEMAWEQLRTHPEYLCVHGAAVQFGERLVLFPNTRRAGKSTLTAALAHLGQTVFSDDFLPISVADDRTISGHASGVAPRIRLPIPNDFSTDFSLWAAVDTGPINRQYKFLRDAPLAAHAARLPLGAIVTLMRSDTPIPPRLDRISQSAAMEAMIVQNFARSIDSGVILRSIEALVASLPTFQLAYHSGEEAAAFLQNHRLLAELPVAKLAAEVTSRQAAFDVQLNRPEPFDPVFTYAQRPDFTEIISNDAHFLADRDGLAIHRLNAGSGAIWRLMAEPISFDEILDVLCAAFPTVAPEQIASDTKRALQQFAQARLIEREDPYSSKRAAAS